MTLGSKTMALVTLGFVVLITTLAYALASALTLTYDASPLQGRL